MTSWDAELGDVDFAETLDTPQVAAGLMLDVLDATLDLLNTPREEVFDPGTLAFADRATGLLRTFVDTGEVPPFGEEEFFEADWTGVQEGLDACYEIVLQRQALGRVVTVDMERGNAACRRAIELQQELIAAARHSSRRRCPGPV
jgi:hypothetical protein